MSNFTKKLLKCLCFCLYIIVTVFFLRIFNDPFLYVSLISALLHEAGHILSAVALGVGIKSVRMTLGGIRIDADFSGIKRVDEVMILLAGSGVNFLLCLISKAVPVYSKEVLTANILLGVFNLLPCEGLDGGSVARIALEWWLLPEKSYKIHGALSHLVLLVIWLFSIPAMIFSGGNPTLYCVFAALLVANMKAFG